MIEKGRHRKPVVPRSERICPVCKQGIEDECHFVTICQAYNEARDDLYRVADNLTSNFKEIPTYEQKFIYMMSNEDPNLLAKLGEYTYQAFEQRRKILND